MAKRKRRANPVRLPLYYSATLLAAVHSLVGVALSFSCGVSQRRRAIVLSESSVVLDDQHVETNSHGERSLNYHQNEFSTSNCHDDDDTLTDLQESQFAKFHDNIRWIEYRLASKKCGYSWSDVEDVVRVLHAAATPVGDPMEGINSLLQLTEVIKLLLEICESTTKAGSSSSFFCSKEVLFACIWHHSESMEAGRRGLLDDEFILHNVLLRHEEFKGVLPLHQKLPSNMHSSIEVENDNTVVIPVVDNYESLMEAQTSQVLNQVIPSMALVTSPIPVMTLCPTSLPNDSLKFDAWTLTRCAARMKRVELLSRAMDSASLSYGDADLIRCLLLTVEGFDWRALMVRCVINLFEIKAATVRSKESIRTAREGLLVFGPLASMLGMHELKSQIEDNAFRFLYPRQYRAAGFVFGDDLDSIESVSSFLHHHVETLLNSDKLLQEQVEHIEVTSRVKKRYSFWKKLLRNSSLLPISYRKPGLAVSPSRFLPWESIKVPDAVALRVIIHGRSSASESDAAKQAKDELLCYYVQDKLKTEWPVWDPIRTKDYIQSPKSNSYQSLHYTSSIDVGEDQLPFEVQVRSHGMHLAAEYGRASHSLYKIPGNATSSLTRIGATQAVQKKPSQGTYGYLDFLEQTRAALSNRHTVVFVANDREHSNKIVCLPSNCQVADVISILSGVSSTNDTLFINGKRSRLDETVENGDVLLLLDTQVDPSTLLT